MQASLTFNDVTLTPITYQNSPWIRSVELALALGYSSEKSVSNIYNRNQDEFSNDMSVVINLSTTDSPAPSRIFSLRGCHLVAMFARTPVAKQFRRWVLDVLDKLSEEERAQTISQPILEVSESPSSVSPSTVADRKPLRTLICTWSQVSGQPFYICWNQLKAAFSLTDIRDLPQEWIPDAIAWVQARIDVLPAGKTAQALPVSPDREAALKDFFDRYDHELYKMEMQLCELDAGYSDQTRDLVQEAAFRLSGGRNSIHIPLDFVIAALHHRQHQVKTAFRSLREDVWETRKVMLSLNRMLRA